MKSVLKVLSNVMRNPGIVPPFVKGGLGGILLSGVISTSAWAMAAQPGKDGQGSGGGFALFMPMILVFLIFYFLLIRPQAKQQKRHQSMLKDIKRGDQVITSSGIHGKITSVTDATVGVEIADNIRIKMEKKQIAQVLNPEPNTDKKS